MLKDTMSINELNTDSKTIVGAINELFQSANNGKQLIANAIGEPLDASDTFSAMSTDINGLLSRFKTNMMNNGVTVNSSDKFKSLIDKIATMVEEGEGKGIQYASGNGNSTSKCEVSLNFKPILVLVQTGKGMIIYLESYSTNCAVYAFYDKYVQVDTLESILGYVNETGFCFAQIGDASWFNWYAIGVGEEDTTLRDSLASVLEDEGVDVTEEDDMASLISKTDEEFDRKNASSGLDIISATELPATGRENQICVITNNPVNDFLITNNSDDIINDSNTIFIYSYKDSGSVLCPITTGNVTTNYYFSRVNQGNIRLQSYVYQNSKWNQLTDNAIALLENGTYMNEAVSGGFTTNICQTYTAGKGITLKSSYTDIVTTTLNQIDFSVYNTVKITVYQEDAVEDRNGIRVAAFIDPSDWASNDDPYYSLYVYKTELVSIPTKDVPKTYTFNVSSWTGKYYLGFWKDTVGHVIICDIVIS